MAGLLSFIITGMPLVVVGLNHTTAPVDIRERFAFAPDQHALALRQLVASPRIDEAALLTTCNRTEIYASTSDGGGSEIINWIHHWHQIDSDRYRQRFYCHTDEQAVRHLLHVSAGLDSLVLGEPQIGGQVKQTWDTARQAGTLGPLLDRWFQRAFHAIKRIRAETAIGRNPVTVPYAAVTLARQIFDDLPQRHALLVGAGDMITLCANYLSAQGMGRLSIANRSTARGSELAAQHAASCHSLDELPAILPQADLVITCTASPTALITREMVKRAIQQRRHAPMLLVDIAVPRDVEPEVARLNDVFLYTIDDLQEVIRNSLRQREQAAADADDIIATETGHFMRWLQQRRASDSIARYRQQAETIRDLSLAQARRQLQAGHDADAVLQQLATQLTNRLLHQPSRSLTDLAGDGRDDLVAALHQALTQDTSAED
ncbi:MAG: glutamyl-tRNA reductase [Wenzhouxiangellaceae bacterium]